MKASKRDDDEKNPVGRRRADAGSNFCPPPTGRSGKGRTGRGISKETGLLKQWPASGPPVVWTATGLGNGYGSMAVAGDRVFVAGHAQRQQHRRRLNRADGKEVWSKALGRGRRRSRARAARHADRGRRSALRAHGERRSRVPQDGRHRGVEAEHPAASSAGASCSG